MIRKHLHSGSGSPHRRRTRTPHPKQLKPTIPVWAKITWGLGFAIILAAILWILRPVFAVLAASAAIAYLLDPVTDFLQTRRISREASIGIIFTSMFIGLLLFGLLFIPSFMAQGETLINNLIPFFQGLDQQLQPALTFISDRTGYQIQLDFVHLQNTAPAWLSQNTPKLQQWGSRLFQGLFTQGLGLLSAIVNLTLMPIFVYYLLRDWDRLIASITTLIPPRYLPRVRRVGGEVNERLNAFVRGQITICIALAVLYSIGLLIVGIDLAVPVGVLSGLLFVVPYLGTAVGIVLSVVLATMKFGFGLKMLAPLVVYVVVQMAEGYWLTPKIVGDKVGLHPLVVMIALIVGGSLLGIWGMLLAIPLTAVFSVLGNEWIQTYFKSTVFVGPDDISDG